MDRQIRGDAGRLGRRTARRVADNQGVAYPARIRGWHNRSDTSNAVRSEHWRRAMYAGGGSWLIRASVRMSTGEDVDSEGLTCHG